MPFFLTNQPVCAPLKDYYDSYDGKYQYPKSPFGAALFAAPEGWMTTDEDGDVKRFGTHKIVEYLDEVDEHCKRWKTRGKDAIWYHFNMPDLLVFYVTCGANYGAYAYEPCCVLDYATYFGGDATGVGECVRHKQVKITGESIEIRYGEEDMDSGALTWVSTWTKPYAEKAEVTESEETNVAFEFSATDNKEVRLGEASSLSLTFGNGEYPKDYTAGLSFDSGATATSIDYTDSGILNWVGTDCTTVDGLSIFQPSRNTHYDIVFYFNGTQFIGLVNGYVPSVSR